MMKDTQADGRSGQQVWWLVLCIALGIGLRFVNLGGPVYWHDEAYTSLRLSGYTATEMVDQVFTGEVRGMEALQPFQTLTPGRGIRDTMRSLVQEDVQHPPLYYVLLRAWAGWWGDSIVPLRCLSALFGVLAVGAAYWFGWELFWSWPQQRTIALVGTALTALSPYHVLYAQEAREYALWTLTTLVASAALLRAMRRPGWWWLYGGSLVAGLYTFPFTGLTLLGHGLYVLLGRRQQLGRWLLAAAIAAVAYLPWLQLMQNGSARQGLGWLVNSLPLLTLLKIWGMHLIRGFVLTPWNLGFEQLLTFGLLLLVVELLVHSSDRLIQETPRSIWLMVITLGTSVILPLILADVVLGGQRSVAGRYLVPFYLAIEWPLAYFLATRMAVRGWRWVLAGLLTVNLLSCGVATQVESTWIKDINYNLPTVARIINQSPEPLLVAKAEGITMGTVMALSHYLIPETRLQLVGQNLHYAFLSPPKLPPDATTVFLLNDTELFRFWLARDNDATVEPAFQGSFLSLWKLQR